MCFLEVQDHPAISSNNDALKTIYKFGFYLLSDDRNFIIFWHMAPLQQRYIGYPNHQWLLFLSPMNTLKSTIDAMLKLILDSRDQEWSKKCWASLSMLAKSIRIKSNNAMRLQQLQC